jgi:4,4'-diaponeurosporenoate glycosyltransferase
VALVAALFGAACAWFTFGRPAFLARSANDEGPTPLATGLPAETAVADISIIVPARNEAGTLPTLLASIARNTLAPAEILVVDDNSTDATAEAARNHGTTLVVAPPPPPGWLGKPWACHLGAQRASSPVLLFLDADVHLAADAIATLCSHHAQLGSGLLSVQPTHRPVRAYEQLSALFNIVGPMGSGAFARHRPRRLRVGFGPCMVTTAADYVAAGGHEAVRHEVIEDIAIAANFADIGRPVLVLLGGELISFRMYPDGPRNLIDGWTKNIAAGAGRAHPASAIAAALWVAALCWVTTSCAISALGWMRHGTVPWVELAAWSVASTQVHVLLRRVGRFHPLTAVLFPIPLGLFVAVFMRSVIRLVFGRTVQWRGRAVPSRAPSPDQ